MVQIRPQSPQAIILKLLVPSNFEHGTEFYAEQLCITFNYLNKIVKQVLGTSTKAYILQRRMQEACRQLQYTTLSVEGIAEELAYKGATYFVRALPADSCNTPRSPWRGLPRSWLTRVPPISCVLLARLWGRHH